MTLFEERAADKCGGNRCAPDQLCPCRDWAQERDGLELQALAERFLAYKIAVMQDPHYCPRWTRETTVPDVDVVEVAKQLARPEIVAKFDEDDDFDDF